MSSQTRREFLGKAIGAITTGAAFHIARPETIFAIPGDIPYRTLGKTSEKVSLLGLGGYHIGVQKNPTESIRIIETAVDRGINFLDNSDDYNDGESESRMGKTIKGKRQRVFLMTKHDGRGKKAALRALEDSLRRLQTDYLDLWQFHSIQTAEEPDWIFSPNGAIEAVYLAKKQGKVRFVGFTGHKNPSFHLKMLSKPYEWDTVQMPLNVLDPHFRSFEKQVLPAAVERSMGVIGMKPMAFGSALKPDVVTPIQCLHYAMNLPVSTVITGCETMELLEQAIRAVVTFKPTRARAVASLLNRTKPFGVTGQYELYKITNDFNNPPLPGPPYEA